MCLSMFVFIRSPDSIQQSLLEASPIAQASPSDLPPFWRGSICAQEIAKVLVSAYLVSGPFTVPREVVTHFVYFCIILFYLSFYGVCSQHKIDLLLMAEFNFAV